MSSDLNIEKKQLPWGGKEVEIIVLDSDSEKDDEMTIEKGDKVLKEVVNIQGSDNAADSKVNNDDMVLDCDDEYIYIYDDDDEHAYLDQRQQEEQRVLEVESDELFLKDDPQGK